LLILTDGKVHDLQATIDRIVKSANLPLSIIIVGVGHNQAEFEEMKMLDADDVPLESSDGKTMVRDLVQFVPFDKFKGNKEKLAQEVLAEVPTQFMQFMKMQNKYPKPRADFDLDSVLSKAGAFFGAQLTK